jgi:transcriptional regulator with XRE-family HTH domain
MVVRNALGESQSTFGGRFGVSRRTLTRWESDGELPPVAQQIHLAVELRHVDAALLRPLLASMVHLHEDVVALVTSATVRTETLPPATAKAQVDGALALMAEELDIGPRKLRAALATLVERLHAAGVAMDGARGALASRVEPSPQPAAATPRGHPIKSR